MKIVVFGPDKRVGVWAGDVVVDLAPLATDLLGLIEGGAGALADAAKMVEAATKVYPIAGVQLQAPHVPGARIACAGGNFADHAAAMAQRTGSAPTTTGIWGFWKVGRDAAGPGADVPYPARTHRLDYEGELAIVLGKPATDVKAADLKPYIWGVTLFADWSIRDQREAAAPLKFGMSKNFNGSFSVGPCIVVGENIDEANVHIETWVNAEQRQDYSTRDMIVSFGEYLEYLTTDFTLHPGDMITGGTAKGTAADSSPRLPDGKSSPERFLKPGDRIEIRSPAIGTLTTHIVAKP